MALAVSLNAPQDALAQAAPLNERTSISDLPLDGPRASMDIGYVNLGIQIFPDAQSIAGEGTYTVTARTDLDTFAFDLDPRFSVTRVIVDGTTVGPAGVSNPDGVLTIRLPEPVSAGQSVAVTIEYSGVPHVARNAPWDGGFVWSSHDGQPWIATAIQGEGCDMFWPCIDHSASRIDRIDTAITVPSGLTAAGNGRFLGAQENSDGTTTFLWSARDPSNYGVSLQIGPYELTERMYESRFGNTIPIQFWHLPESKAGARRLVAEMETYLDFFESTIGPYPFSDEKAGIVETPHLGMEHQTINAYGNRFRRDPLGYDWLLHHEFAHEWFANQLKHATKNHMWLHEGIGTWMQPLYLGWMHGEMYYTAEMWRQRQQINSRVPLVPAEGTLPDYNDRAAGWGTDIYAKGSWIMHTMRYLVGEDELFEALTMLTYGTHDPEPGEISPVLRTTDDFRQILEDQTGRDLAWFFDAYFYHAELPRLEMQRDGARLTLEWHTPADLPFEMPVEVMADGELQVVAMSGGTGQMEIDGEYTHVQLDPRNQILMYDEAIARWQASR